jgi:error-prone DNA polymerase
MPEAANPKLRPVVPPPSASRGISTLAYAELDVTTNFSFLRGASHPDELIYRAAELGHAAIAVTDLNSLAGIVRAHQAAKEIGIRFCVGSRLSFSDAPDVLVWVENRRGYANVCRLLTAGKRRTEKGSCLLRLDDLLCASDGLHAAIVPQRIDPELERRSYDEIESAAGRLRETFGRRLSIAISRFGEPADQVTLEDIASLGRAYGIPLLATNQVHYHADHRQTLQDVMTCIRHGCTIQNAGFRLFPNGERFIKSPQEMHRLFSDQPTALRRSVEIAEQCVFSLDELRYEYPDEVVPAGKTPAWYLAELAWAGAAERYPRGIPEKIRQQVSHELKLIEELKIEPYFLTVYDLVHFARSKGILCQGRGSAANSAVCYCIGVTSVDPTRIDLLFERFVSSARNEPPDIDVDFEHERREEVIQYVYNKYGRERSGMTAEVISYRPRSAVRDVGKAMGLGLDAVDHMAKSIEAWQNESLLDEQARQAGLDTTDRTLRLVLTLTRELLGFPRHLGQHVGGMVMTRGPLCELVPIENATMQDRTMIEWDKDDIDALGILKVDVLALGMLTAIAKALKLVNDTHPARPPIELHTIPAEDPGVYAMVSDADTIGVFQIESRAQMSMLPRLKPVNFYDLVIEVAIVRPGPIQGDMVHPYLRRRDGIEPVSFPKPELKAVLGKTLGVPLFQEQAMRIAIECAGFTPAEADRLRRAVTGFRRYGDIETFARQFMEGMVQRGFAADFAQRCFAQIRGFSTYGFPESHAASFALLVYASAWLKRYHPGAFCCALLNSQPMGFYHPAQIVRDAQEHGVTVRAVDVNHSHWDCTLEDVLAVSALPTGGDKRIWGIGGPVVRLGFRQIKGFPVAQAQRIADCRSQIGLFRSIDHFQQATGLSVAAITRLSEADAFGSLPKTRRAAMWETLALPDERLPLLPALPTGAAPQLPAMTARQEIYADYGTTGLSLKGHPVALIRDELRKRRIITAADMWKRPAGKWVRVAGIVTIRQRPGTAKGIVFVTMEDETGIVNLIVRPHVFDRYRAAVRHASLLQVDGEIERQGKVQHIVAARLLDLTEAFSGRSFHSRDFH